MSSMEEEKEGMRRRPRGISMDCNFLKMTNSAVAELSTKYSLSGPRLDTCNCILDAACTSTKFQFVEIWSNIAMHQRGTSKIFRAQKKWKPYCIHMYSVPHTINDSIVSKEQGRRCDLQRFMTSTKLVDVALSASEPCWLTAGSPQFDHLFPPEAKNNMNFPPFQTVLALPLNKRNFCGICNAGDVVLVFYGFNAYFMNKDTLAFLDNIGTAAIISIAQDFHIKKRDSMSAGRGLSLFASQGSISSGSHGRKLSNFSYQSSNFSSNFSYQLVDQDDLFKCDYDVDMKFELLRDVKFWVNGSRCTIYEGRIDDHPDILIKMVRKDAIDKKRVTSELKSEINILKQISHPYIVDFIGAGSTPEIFLCIRRLNGGTLAERVGAEISHNAKNPGRFSSTRPKAGKPFTTAKLMICIYQIALAMEYLHTEAIPNMMILHRDLKPDNIIFDLEGNIKIIDFGLSRVIMKDNVLNSPCKMTGHVGSLRYMAPEVALHQPYNHKLDVYSYGLIVWQMASMMAPFQNFSRDEFFTRVVDGRYRPNVYTNYWPEEFRNLIVECWAHDPNARPDFTKIVKEICNLEKRLSNQAIPQPPIGYLSRIPHSESLFVGHQHKPRRRSCVAEDA